MLNICIYILMFNIYLIYIYFLYLLTDKATMYFSKEIQNTNMLDVRCRGISRHGDNRRGDDKHWTKIDDRCEWYCMPNSYYDHRNFDSLNQA